VIKQSWTSEELGELFYLNLSREAPYLVHLFQVLHTALSFQRHHHLFAEFSSLLFDSLQIWLCPYVSDCVSFYSHSALFVFVFVFLCAYVQRPKKMQAYLFMQAIDLIVQFGEEPEHFFHQLKPLVIRHIKYGVKTEVSLDNLSGQHNLRPLALPSFA